MAWWGSARLELTKLSLQKITISQHPEMEKCFSSIVFDYTHISFIIQQPFLSFLFPNFTTLLRLGPVRTKTKI